jgi:hypothetical protein
MKLFTLVLGISMLATVTFPAVAAAAPAHQTTNKTSAQPSAKTAPEAVGYDISWPQCSKRFPSAQAFGIVGVNGGNAANTNPCLASQLTWANQSVGGSAQPKSQLYVNTGNPGEVISQVTTWPTSNTDKTGTAAPNTYGTCAGANDAACSWQYGWNRAVEDNLDRFVPAATSSGTDPLAGDYTWWLDVETSNTWQTSSPNAHAFNAATLEGMTAYFSGKGAKVGLYSTAAQWGTIAGTVPATSNLAGLANWRPSGASLNNAVANCSVAPLTPGGFMSLTQYVQQNVDKNHSCL